MMISLSDQFSAARLTQLDNGFNLMRSLSEQALDRASRVFALQLDASRAAVEQSSNAMRQLLAARDPRDLLTIGSQSQQQLRSIFDYSRELMSIAADVNLTALRTYRVDSLGTPAASPDTAAEIANAASATVPATAPSIILQADAQSPSDFALPTATAAAPAIIITSDIAPAVAPAPIAKATGEALDLAVAPPHPLAASVPVEVAVEIELPKIEPIEASPPPAAPSSGPVETRGAKGRKRQG